MKRPVEGSEAATRVLVFAPVGRDAELTHEFLNRASIPNSICESMAQLCGVFDSGGGGALLLTEEALDDPAFTQLTALLNGQPSWSDVPVLLFAGSPGADMTLHTIRAIESLRNVTLFERPIRLAACWRRFAPPCGGATANTKCETSSRSCEKHAPARKPPIA